MAGVSKKKRGGKKSGAATAAVAKEEVAQLDELFVPKKSSAAADEQEQEDDDEQIELKVNEKFAKTFLEQKRKEELNRLEKQRKLYGDDDDDASDSESETEDEDGEQLTRALDADIRKTLKLIRKKDPAIYDTSIAFFKKDEADGDDSGDSDGEGSRKRKKAAKKSKADAPLYYKDLVRQQVIAGDVDSDDERDEASSRVMTYGEEQAKLKQDFLSTLKNAAGSDDDNEEGDNEGNDDEAEDGDDLDGGLFKIRKKTEDEKKAEEDEFASFTNKYGSALKKSEVDPDAFLEHYLSSEGWKDKKNVIPTYDEIVNDDEDAEELEKAEEFEHSYNFRFEEEGSGLIQTYARRIEDTMRREDDSRKRKRAERKERKALERLKKEEELRRLKNLKQAEIQSKLEKVARLMGKDTPEALALKLKASDLEGEFDPEEYDKRMQEVFDEEYYNEDDEGMEKPTWDDEEDKELFAGLPVDPEEEEEMEEAEEEEEEQQVPNIIEPEDDEDEDEEEDAGEDDEADENDDDALSEEKVKKMTPAELKRAKQKYLDELYSLDYEDLIGDLKCRFKYRNVKTNDFGLTVDEIMAADDKELKSLVSLKRMAPYLDEEYQIDRKRVKKFKKGLEEAKRERMEKRKKKQEAADEGAANDDEDTDEVAGETKTSKAAAEGDAKAVGKKRKRTKKSKQNAAVADTGDEQSTKADEPQADAETATKSKAGKDEAAEAGGEDASKKKQRRSKKKGGEKNAFKATGLTSSRLESYKLTKPSKK